MQNTNQVITSTLAGAMTRMANAAVRATVNVFTMPEHGCSLLETWQKRIRDREALAHMDRHLLADIGLDRSTARHEAEKPFWQA